MSSKLEFNKIIDDLFPGLELSVTLKSSFLDIGGDSIIAAKLASIIYKKWGVKLSISDIFKVNEIEVLLGKLPDNIRKENKIYSGFDLKKNYVQSGPQQSIYLEFLKNPLTTAYNIPIVAHVPIAVSAPEFQEAVQKIAESFPVLFTTYFESDNSLMFRYNGVNTVSLSRYDSLRHAEQEFVRPFNLSCDVLLRAGIVPFDGHKTVLMLDFSHIVADGLSVGFFLTELRKCLYKQPLQEGDCSVFDFCQWAVSKEYHDKATKAENYWKRTYLNEAITSGWPLLKVSNDLERGYAIEHSELSPVISDRIRGKIEQTNITSFNYFFLGWYILQSELLESSRLNIGLVTSGRIEPEYNNTFGMFVNTNIIPVSIPSNISVFDALSIISTSVREKLEYQNVPYSKQVKLLNQSYDIDFKLEAIFAYQNIDYQKIDFYGGNFQSFFHAKKMAQFGMVVQVFELSNNRYEIQWEYDCKSYSFGFISDLLSRYKKIIELIVEVDDTTILSFISESNRNSEREQSNIKLVDFNF